MSGHFTVLLLVDLTGLVASLPIMTVRELLMLRFMNLVTDKPDWQRKVSVLVVVEALRAHSMDG